MRVAAAVLGAATALGVVQQAASAVTVPPVHLTAKPLDARPTAAARRLLVSAHNAGDTTSTARRAVAAHTGMVEIDVNWANGDLVAAHDLQPAFVPGDALELADSWTATKGAPAVLLDLKSNSRASVAAIDGFISSHPGRPVYLSAPDPATLAAAHGGAPWTIPLLSLTEQTQLDRFLAGGNQIPELAGVSINQRLLTRAVVDALRDRHLQVLAYSVDSMRRTNELAGWGVTAITTDSTTIMHSLSGHPTARQATTV